MTASPRTQFAESRAKAERERAAQRQQAVRTVAGNARDSYEFSALVAMLGLDDVGPQPVSLDRRLADYVRQVSTAIGVSADAVRHDATDTAIAHIPLDRRSTIQPDRDLTLVWDERLGWYVAARRTPAEPVVVMAYLTGDLVPPPSAVARFVADITDGRYRNRIRPVLPPIERTVLAAKMASHGEPTVEQGPSASPGDSSR